jgi:hypothetical protein
MNVRKFLGTLVCILVGISKQNIFGTGFYSNSEGFIHMYSNTQCSAKYFRIWNKHGSTFLKNDHDALVDVKMNQILIEIIKEKFRI